MNRYVSVEMALNPRNLRAELGPFVGKKVTIGTKSGHYVCGIVCELEGLLLKLTVAGETVVVPGYQVEIIREAPILQAEYVK